MNKTTKIMLTSLAGIALVMSLAVPLVQSAYANRTGTEGCTPGYWKNHTERWTSGITVLVGGNVKVLTPTTLVSYAFDVDFIDNSYDTMTLLEALNLNGGAQNALLRQGVAALLDSSEIPSPIIGYSLTDDQVYDRVRDGLDPLYVANLSEFADDDDTEALKNFLDAANNGQGGCPLN